jgi:hypothetical protein
MRILGVLGGVVRVTLEEGNTDIYGVQCPMVETFLGQEALEKMPDRQRIAGNVTWGDVKRLVKSKAAPDDSGVFLTAAFWAGKKPG